MMPPAGSHEGLGKATQPLQPGRPQRGLWWLRPFGSRSLRAKATVVGLTGLAIAFVLSVGTWGFYRLNTAPHLGLLLSIYRSVHLFAFDLGPAAGGNGSPRANWQLWAAFVVAGLLVLRGALLVVRQRTRGLAVRYLLQGHVVICGAGGTGTRLAQILARDHDVVLVDREPGPPGLAAGPAPNEWRVTGDCVREDTLLSAGITRANWVLVTLGDDLVGSQVASTVRSLAKAKRLRDRAHLLVRVEHPALAHFLEEGEEIEADQGLPSPLAPSITSLGPVVSTFSTGAIAAENLLDEPPAYGGPSLSEELFGRNQVEAPSLLLAGDDPFIDAVLVAVLRRGRAQLLRQLEGDSGERWRALHIMVLGRGALTRAEAFSSRWAPEPEVLSLEARDLERISEEMDWPADWLQRSGRSSWAVVACRDEVEGVELSLQLAQALGGTARLTRLTAGLASSVDLELQERTMKSPDMATTDVRALPELSCRPELIAGAGGRKRLEAALAAQGIPTTEASKLSEGLYERGRALGIRKQFSWRVRPSERPLLEALLGSVPLSAMLSAGLRVDLGKPANLRLAAERLSEEASPFAFSAWCEYLTQLRPTLSEAPSPPPGGHRLEKLVRLYRAALGDDNALAGLAPHRGVLKSTDRVTIIAGGAESMKPTTGAAIAELLRVALYRYEGMVLSGGSSAGVPAIVGDVCQELGLSNHLVGYTPPGRGDPGRYPVLRETEGAVEFSVDEPLAMWADILGSGVPLENVRVLVFPGGDIVTEEILLSRALRARVAFIDPGKDLPASLDYLLPLGSKGVLEVPADPMSARAFLQWSQLPPGLADAIGRFVHSRYRAKSRGNKAPNDPALVPWDDLPTYLKHSNLAQANDIPNKLALLGVRLAQPGRPLVLSQEQRELLAEAEHGRWNLERLSAGWQSGQRQMSRSLTPYLIPWSQLDEAVRAFDFDAVDNIAPGLAEAGWGAEPREGPSQS
jgi:hypothetical protein